jgi:hypothetical protein
LCANKLDRTGSDAACTTSNAGNGKIAALVREPSLKVLPSMERMTDCHSPAASNTGLRHCSTTSDSGSATGNERTRIASMKL